MKTQPDKTDLVQEVVDVIYQDLMSGDKSLVEGLLFNISEDRLIKYLPPKLAEDFKTLRL